MRSYQYGISKMEHCYFLVYQNQFSLDMYYVLHILRLLIYQFPFDKKIYFVVMIARLTNKQCEITKMFALQYTKFASHHHLHDILYIKTMCSTLFYRHLSCCAKMCVGTL